MKNGFTLIELIVVIAIIAVLSTVILFSVNIYINKGKDSNVSGSLAILVPAGEVYYNGFPNAYGGVVEGATETFCESSIVENTISQMPVNLESSCYSESNPAGVCCYVESQYFQAWAACALKFADTEKAYCVDSRGVRKEIPVGSCHASITSCSF